MGTADANGQPTKSTGFARYAVVVGTPGPPDESDVTIEYQVTDVRNKSDLTDYSGELQASVTVRTSDHRAGPPGQLGGNQAGTIVDVPFLVFGPVQLSCATTADTTVGSTCSALTSANAITPGAVQDGKRMISETVSAIEVSDGGADGISATSPNTTFLREGVFIP